VPDAKSFVATGDIGRRGGRASHLSMASGGSPLESLVAFSGSRAPSSRVRAVRVDSVRVGGGGTGVGVDRAAADAGDVELADPRRAMAEAAGVGVKLRAG
jgi:hypothetical protein